MCIRDRLQPCPIEIPGFTEKLQWHKHQDRDPAIVWLRSLLRETAQSLPEVKSLKVARPAARSASPRRRA